MIQAPIPAHMLFNPYSSNMFSTCPSGSRPLFKMATKLQVDCLWQAKFAIHIICMCKLHFCCVKYVIQLHLFHYFSIIWLKPISITEQNMKTVITFSQFSRFHSFPVVDWFCLFIYLWVLTFPLEDCSEFGSFVITLIYFALLGYTGIDHCRISRHGVLYQHLFKVLPNMLWLSLWIP